MRSASRRLGAKLLASLEVSGLPGSAAESQRLLSTAISEAVQAGNFGSRYQGYQGKSQFERNFAGSRGLSNSHAAAAEPEHEVDNQQQDFQAPSSFDLDNSTEVASNLDSASGIASSLLRDRRSAVYLTTDLNASEGLMRGLPTNWLYRELIER